MKDEIPDDKIKEARFKKSKSYCKTTVNGEIGRKLKTLLKQCYETN